MMNKIKGWVGRFFCMAAFLMGWFYPLYAAEKASQDLFDLSLEELKQTKITVTSVSKKEQDLFSAASAVCVIEQKDIHRSGLTSIPELLRLCPGMDVAQASSQKWLVSVRGFNALYANKLLVLADGRTLYTPLFGGVYWEVQDYPLADIDRIEVIRGPGATLWGANAVNGVINITSKKAIATQGTSVHLTGGNQDRLLGTVRQGGKINRNTHYRLYAQHSDRDAFRKTDESSLNDRWNIQSGGFQVDGTPHAQHRWMLQGRVYSGGGKIPTRTATLPTETLFNEKNVFSGGHVLANWQYSQTPHSNWTTQTYFDRTDRNERPLFKEGRNAWDIDVQHHVLFSSRQDIVWGLGYHGTNDKITTGLALEVDPPHRTESVYSAFVQDELSVRPDFHLIVGSKFERNVYTTFEVQPSGRVIWMPNTKHSIWGSISRAVQVPTRAARDMSFYDSTTPGEALALDLPLRVKIYPNKQHKSEVLMAYELGYRTRPRETLLLDFTAFVHNYRKMQGIHVGDIVGMTSPTDHYEAQTFFANNITAETWGFEWLGSWQVLQNWALKAAYAYINLQAHSKDSTDYFSAEYLEGTTPQHQLQLHSSLNLPHAITAEMGVYGVSDRPAVEVLGYAETPQYVRLDLSLGWRPIQNLELSLAGQHLLESQTTQINLHENYLGGDIKRSVYAKAVWHL